MRRGRMKRSVATTGNVGYLKSLSPWSGFQVRQRAPTRDARSDDLGVARLEKREGQGLENRGGLPHFKQDTGIWGAE